MAIGGIKSSDKNKNEEGKNFLLMIGIDKYHNLPQLYNCVGDVKNVAEILTSKYQFEYENLFFLLEGEATRANIYKTFFELINLIKKNDSLIIYFAGHGEFNKRINEGYWIPIDASRNQFDTYISMTELTKLIKSIIAKHVLVIGDSSYSYKLIRHDSSR